MKRLTTLLGALLLFSSQMVAQYDQRRSLMVRNTDDRKGVATATAYLDYAIRKFDGEIWIPVSYSKIEVTPEAGYWHNGKLYKSEVPGLIELLRTGKCSAPTVKFNVYYNNIKIDTRTVFITETNNLGLLGDVIRLKATEAQLKNPAYRLEAVEMTSFNNVDWWYTAVSLIEKYEREKKDAADYKELIYQADGAFSRTDLVKAQELYSKATRHKLADTYPSRQLEKVREALKKEKGTQRFDELMKEGTAAESAKDYAQALRQYSAAAKLGIDDSRAAQSASRVQRTLNQLKAEEEQRLLAEQQKNEQEAKAAADKLKTDKQTAERLLREKEEALQKELAEKQEQEAQALKANEKKLYEENLKKQLQEQQEKWEKKQKEEQDKAKKEKQDRDNRDKKLLDRFKNGMEWDPVRYNQARAKADSFFQAGMQIDPYGALDLKKEWWDNNMFMESFRDDLNEPRRQEAWKKSQSLLFDQEHQFSIAKYYYMEAVQYTDEGSSQYRYLMSKMKMMNDLLDMQNTAIKASRLGEEIRQKAYEDAKVWKVINRRRENEVRSQLAYQHLRQQYLYPNHNYKGPDASKAIQKQFDYENRLNAADQQLRQDNAVTGMTHQLAVGALVDENKVAATYGEGAMGFNLFAFTGGLTYPVVSNTEDNDDYVMSSSTDNLAVMPFNGGFDWWIRRGRVWDLGLTGDLTLGVLPMLGSKNFYVSYGFNAKVNLGFKALKLALEADWHNRSGSYEYDDDVAQQDNQWRQNTGLIWKGEMNYSVLRAGAGLHIQYGDEYGDGYLRLMTYAEKPSFYQNYNFSRPVVSFGALWMMRGGFSFMGSYAQNYPVAGEAKYFMRKYSTRDHWSFSVGKIWTIGKTH
ncbi:MAG TPA: hypothetical protein VGN63_13955 [Flavisolibacter sp.]|jgi:hypothetical protein|nr:hypothetical protein [Flavisolibacter sp.]